MDTESLIPTLQAVIHSLITTLDIERDKSNMLRMEIQARDEIIRQLSKNDLRDLHSQNTGDTKKNV